MFRGLGGRRWAVLGVLVLAVVPVVAHASASRANGRIYFGTAGRSNGKNVSPWYSLLPSGRGLQKTAFTGFFYDFVFSPDGSWVAYDVGGLEPKAQVWVARVDGSAAHEIGIGSKPAWTASGDVVWTQSDADCANEEAPTGGAPATILCVSAGSGALDGVWPSPDSAHLAFEQGSQLWLASADGSNARVLLGQDVADAQWSSDGRKMLVRVFSSSGTPPFEILDVRTGAVLLTLRNLQWAALSPDGKAIAAIRNTRSGRFELLDADGGHARRPTLSVNAFGLVAWRPA